MVMQSGPYYKEFSEGFRLTTNNRMELLATIRGMEMLKKTGLEVHIHSDSKYVVDAINKGWLFNWEKKSFKGKKNEDLWRKFLPVYRKVQPKLHWVKGHNNHPQNERCDALAVNAYKNGTLKIDNGFEIAQRREENLL